jgi:hypothetical protein
MYILARSLALLHTVAFLSRSVGSVSMSKHSLESAFFGHLDSGFPKRAIRSKILKYLKI